MTGNSAGWSPERKARHSAFMKKRNADPDFAARRKPMSPELRDAKRVQFVALNADPEFRAKQRASVATRKPRRTPPPKHAHPVVRGFFREMADQGASRERIATPAGVSKHALTGWRRTHMPLLDMIDAALGVLDLELAIVPRGTRDEYGFPKKKTRTLEGVQS